MKLVHLSDLHFGTEVVKVDALVEAVQSLNPELIVISGDFTQRATSKQYRAAQKFIMDLNHPNILSVPGNHDISIHHLFERFFLTFEKYKKYISENLNPLYISNKVAVLGINSVAPFKRQDGEVSKKQLELIKEVLQKLPADTKRIIVMHHNMIHSAHHRVISNLDEVMQTFVQCKVNLILTGHLHDACLEQILKNMYHITAGTALSFRLRTQPNSFNLLEIEDHSFKFSTYNYNEHGTFNQSFIGTYEI